MMRRAVVALLLVSALAGCSQAPESADPVGSPSVASSLVGREFPVVKLTAWGSASPVDSIDVVANRVVNLWASWCASCRAEFGLMTKSPNAQFIVALNVSDAVKSDAARKAGQPLVDSAAGSFPVFVDSGDTVLSTLGISGLPVTLAVDGQGRIVDVQIGPLDDAALTRLAKAATAE
jgi:thiol-disulfide isomerase/thioredoxin